MSFLSQNCRQAVVLVRLNADLLASRWTCHSVDNMGGDLVGKVQTGHSGVYLSSQCLVGGGGSWLGAEWRSQQLAGQIQPVKSVGSIPWETCLKIEVESDRGRHLSSTSGLHRHMCVHLRTHMIRYTTTHADKSKPINLCGQLHVIQDDN